MIMVYYAMIYDVIWYYQQGILVLPDAGTKGLHAQLWSD